MLTDLQVRKMPLKGHRYEVLDGNGLYVRVHPSGAKSWIFRYNFEGVARRMTLGAYPGVTMAMARERHAVAVSDLQRGIDPGAKAKEVKSKRKAAPNFEELLSEFWEMELGKTPSGSERWRLVKKDALTPWRKKKVKDITRRDAVILLDLVRERAPITANRLQGVLVRMFNFAAERGIIKHSPLVGMRKTREVSRKRTLTDAEIKALWAALHLENKDIDIYRVTKLALKLILLTGQRPGEIAGMAWDEIDADAMLWNIPASRMKGAEPQIVPICPMAWAVIEEARTYNGNDCPFVFRSSHKLAEAITRPSITRAISRHWSEIEGIEQAFTPHDLRRTVRTKLAELGIGDIVAERLLGHKLQGMLAIYNQHPYLKEKRHALERWENRLAQIVSISEHSKGKIIQFRGRQG